MEEISPTRPSNQQIEQFKAWAGLTLAFTLFLRPVVGELALWQSGVFISLCVGMGLALHEWAHRRIAQHYGVVARMQAFSGLLVASIVFAGLGFLVPAPSALHHDPLPKRESGRIALVGPLSHLVVALLWLLGLPMFDALGWRMAWLFAYLGYTTNAWLALFNLLPLGRFDGAAILEWDKVMFVGVAALCSLLVIVQYLPIGRDLVFHFGF